MVDLGAGTPTCRACFDPLVLCFFLWGGGGVQLLDLDTFGSFPWLLDIKKTFSEGSWIMLHPDDTSGDGLEPLTAFILGINVVADFECLQQIQSERCEPNSEVRSYEKDSSYYTHMFSPIALPWFWCPFHI